MRDTKNFKSDYKALQNRVYFARYLTKNMIFYAKMESLFLRHRKNLFCPDGHRRFFFFPDHEHIHSQGSRIVHGNWQRRSGMDILVIGGTRFFGIPMVKRLLENGHRVTIASRGSHGSPFGEAAEQVIMDRTDENSVMHALGGRQYDVIIDKVAYASNDVRTLLKHAHCKRYMQMSSCAVYKEAHLLISEDESDPQKQDLLWMDRTKDYALGKRQAERAALEFLDPQQCTFVRYPVVLGPNDYTGRLKFYAEHICGGIPLYADPLDTAVSYIHETEAGDFIAYLAENPVAGAFNGCSQGIISQKGIIDYIESRTGKKAVISPDGDPAPYNGVRADTSYSCAKAEKCGYHFSELSSWIFELLDSYISECAGTM